MRDSFQMLRDGLSFRRLQDWAARSPDWIALLAIAVVWGTLAIYTWAHWGHTRTDCGREMYVPWQILEGKLLYRDLWYLYGPLAPYLKAGLFAVFGVHLSVLYAFGLVIALGMAFTFYVLGREFAPRIVATTGSVCFLFQAFQTDLFNFVLPYSYAAALGAWLGLACVFCLVRYVKTGQPRPLIWAGWTAASALLDKQEFGLICYLVLGGTVALRAAGERSWRPVWRGLRASTPGVALSLATYGFFAWKTGPAALLLENFQQTPQSHFMQTYGTIWLQHVGFRFALPELAWCALSAAVCLAFWFVLGHAVEPANRRRLVWILLLAVIVYAWTLLDPFVPRGFSLAPFLPRGLMWGVAGAAIAWAFRRARGDVPAAALLVLAAYGLLSGMRVLVEMKPTGYAIFYNEVPLLILLVLIARITPARPSVLRLLMAIQVVGFAWMAWPQPEERSWLLQTARGTIYTHPGTGAGMAHTIRFLEEQKRSGKTAVLLSDETLLYFLVGLHAPEPWYQLTPGVVSPDQETRYIEKLRQIGPDYILISNRRYPEYRADTWGINYNQQIFRWISNHYRYVHDIQASPREYTPASAKRSYVVQVYERPKDGDAQQ